MNFCNFLFCLLITVMLPASGVFAQTTHMGVPAKDMVVLVANCSKSDANPECQNLGNSTFGVTYRRILANGNELVFTMPERKVLIITDYEWRYHESGVTEDSANDRLAIAIAYAPILGKTASMSQSSLTVTPESGLSTQGNAFGSAQMTSGFVASIVPTWSLNREILDAPEISVRSFRIVLRGYLLDVP